MLANLEVGTLTRVLRPTLLSALVAGVIAVGVALLLGSTPAAGGIVLGVGVAVLNLRMLASGVARIETGAATVAPAGPDGAVAGDPHAAGGAGADGPAPAGVRAVPDVPEPDAKVIRRILRTRSATRLVLITVVAVGLVLVAPPLGIGMVVGLVIFQIAFVANAGRAILSAQIV